jgi:hypothetical protein
VGRICADLDAKVAAFRDRSPADTAFQYKEIERRTDVVRVGFGESRPPRFPTREESWLDECPGMSGCGGRRWPA